MEEKQGGFLRNQSILTQVILLFVLYQADYIHAYAARRKHAERAHRGD